MIPVPNSDLESLLLEFTTPGGDGVHGVVLKAVNKNGNLIYDKAIGLNSVKEGADPIESSGVMWVASCTKLLTSIAALQLVEQGLISLDEPVSSILPELADAEIISADTSVHDGFTLRPAGSAITLRQLITHTSGLGYEILSPSIQTWRKTQPQVSLDTMATAFNIPLLFEPGEGWVYGGGLDWTGELVSRATGKTLGAYFEENIFQPLGGWDSTTFELDQKPELKKRIVGCGLRTHNGGLEHVDGSFPQKVTEHSGGHGLWSSPTDFIKILTDLLKESPTVLKKETIEGLMFTPQLTNASALRALAPTANAVPEDAGVNYGLGGMLMVKDSEYLPKGTLSWGGMPNLKWFINRDQGVAALYATQILPPEDPKSMALMEAFFKEVVGLNKE